MPNAKSLKLLADVMNAATWEWHIPSGEIFVNQRWSQMLGYRPEELATFSIETWKSLTHPDDLEKAMLTLDKVLNKGEEFYSAELRIRHKDGHWHYILDSGKVIERDENGKAIRALGTHIDIHERKMLEQEYRRTQQMLNEVVHHTRDIIYRTDGRGKLLYLSDAVTQYLGYSQEQAVWAFEWVVMNFYC